MSTEINVYLQKSSFSTKKMFVVQKNICCPRKLEILL